MVKHRQAPVSGSLPNPVPGRSIEEHGIVGNLETAALIALDGTIDFMCWPAFDGPSVFAALLDPDRGGCFELAPVLKEARAAQLYLPDTNVLVTRWLSETGSAELVDLMPFPTKRGAPRMLVRRMRATRGRVPIRLCCHPRFDYARVEPTVRRRQDGIHFTAKGQIGLRLAASIPLETEHRAAVADFTLGVGQEAIFVLSDPAEEAPDLDAIGHIIDETVLEWRRWAEHSSYVGRWREQVTRSALTLKLLTSHSHGSIAAAATFALPEASGAGRNWDYRATWLRDASFTIYAFMRLGYVDEAERFRRWISDRARGAVGGELRIMYALNGAETPDETELDHLAGYGGARPVRIGNAAHKQRQLDVYGELMDSIYLANKYGTAVGHEAWRSISHSIDAVCTHWNQKDSGIWEMRGAERHFLHSRLMSWVAIDRAMRLAIKRSLPAPLTKWHDARDRVGDDIWANFRHPKHGYFVQTKGSAQLDASLLMMPLVRFVSATDPVWLKTLDAIGEFLCDDGMIYRYRGDDGLKGSEGAFTACTFWYVECLARAGRLDDARLVMGKGLSRANHLGLFSEELDKSGRQLGNFPQALTHLAFISAAHFLNRRLDQPSGGEWQP
jgi:GH15 family glucan-1,4-alpha-glucosidase